MSSSELKIEAKERLMGKKKEAAILVLIFLIVVGVLGSVCGVYKVNNVSVTGFDGETIYEKTSAADIGVQKTTPAQSLGSLVFFVVNTFLTLGMTSYFLKISRGEDAKIDELWSKGNLLLKTLAVAIVSGVLIAIGCLLLIIPGIILAYCYSMTTYIILDNPDMGIIDVLKNSRTMMSGNKWRFFCLGISFIGWMILLPFTLGILSLWLLPYMNVAQCLFYNYLIGKTGVDSAVEVETTVEGE